MRESLKTVRLAQKIRNLSKKLKKFHKVGYSDCIATSEEVSMYLNIGADEGIAFLIVVLENVCSK